MNTATLFLRVDRAEQRLCRVANAAVRRRAVRMLFRIVSRLGDGMAWYLLIALLPLALGAAGLAAALQMLVAGALCLGCYRWLKPRFVRERPYVGLVGIECAMPPLDRYSFPSGHTLHAVSFTVVALHHVPTLVPLLLPFTMLIAASRVVLGLHYPTDVAAGAALGGLIGAGVLLVAA